MVLEGGTNPGILSKISSGRNSPPFSGNRRNRSMDRSGNGRRTAALGADSPSAHLRVSTWYTTKAGQTTDFMNATSTSQNVPECVWR